VRGVEVSELELGTDGGITVKSLATIFEDGEVVGASYLASSLRKSVEARGPMDLESTVRLYNNGYYGASWVNKGRVYLKEGQEAPADMQVKEGPRGGRYYHTGAGRGRPLGEAPSDWKPREGERIRLRIPGDKRNGRLGKITSLTEEGKGYRGEKLWATVEGVGWRGGGYFNINDGQLVPAPYTAKEKKEMKARDILVTEFGKTRVVQRPFMDRHTGIEYDAFNTEAGPILMVKTDPPEDKPWVATKESAVSLSAFLKALPEMSREALQNMKDEVEIIYLSPVSNPSDRKISKRIGKHFTAAATMQMGERVMHIYPKAKESDNATLAYVITHETGHAVDNAREYILKDYNEKRNAFWAQVPSPHQAGKTPDEVERDAGMPPHPGKWLAPYYDWRGVQIAIKYPDTHRRSWGMFFKDKDWEPEGDKTWNELREIEKLTVTRKVNTAAPVSAYALTSNEEYYAEAYAEYQKGKLTEGHIMQEHFENLERTRQWLEE